MTGIYETPCHDCRKEPWTAKYDFSILMKELFQTVTKLELELVQKQEELERLTITTTSDEKEEEEEEEEETIV